MQRTEHARGGGDGGRAGQKRCCGQPEARSQDQRRNTGGVRRAERNRKVRRLLFVVPRGYRREETREESFVVSL